MTPKGFFVLFARLLTILGKQILQKTATALKNYLENKQRRLSSSVLTLAIDCHLAMYGGTLGQKSFAHAPLPVPRIRKDKKRSGTEK
jgi:hypothetical protein